MRPTTITTWLLAAASLSMSCSGPVDPPRTALGELEGSDAVVAVSVSGSQWVFYVCGGGSSYATLTHWLSGDGIVETHRAFEGTDHGWFVQGTANATGWSGSLTSPDGVSRPWSVRTAEAATAEGLYEVVDSGCRTGVIVRPDPAGSGYAVQGAWCDDQGRFEQVTPVLPVSLESGSLRVRVSLASGVRDLLVRPARIPLSP